MTVIHKKKAYDNLKHIPFVEMSVYLSLSNNKCIVDYISLAVDAIISWDHFHILLRYRVCNLYLSYIGSTNYDSFVKNFWDRL